MTKLKNVNWKKVFINAVVFTVVGFCVTRVISIFTDRGIGADGKPYYTGFDDEPSDEPFPGDENEEDD